MRKVMVSGATSMIGTETIRICLEQGIDVFALVRPNSKNLDRLPDAPNLKIVECDLSNLSNININDKNLDCFYHFGWRRTDRDNPNDWLKQVENIEDTLKAVELADKVGCKKFVGAGTLLEYGQITKKAEVNDYVVPDTIYASAKYSAGIMSRALCKSKKIEHIWARIFGVYGLFDEEKTLFNYAIHRMANNQDCDFTLCEQVWDYIYNRDCAEAFYKIGLHGKNNAIYNIGTGKGFKLKEYIMQLKKILGSKSKINFGAIKYAEYQPMHYIADIENLVADTGWTPKTEFASGINELLSSMNYAQVKLRGGAFKRKKPFFSILSCLHLCKLYLLFCQKVLKQ